MRASDREDTDEEPRSAWTRLERLLPFAALVFCLVLGGLWAHHNHRKQYGQAEQRTAALFGVVEANHARAVDRTLAKAEQMNADAGRLQTMARVNPPADQVIAQLGPDAAERFPALLGAVTITRGAGSAAPTSVSPVAGRLDVDADATIQLASQLATLAVMETIGEVHLVSIEDTLALLVPRSDDVLALLFDKADLTSAMSPDSPAATTTVTPRPAGEEKPIETMAVRRNDGRVVASNTVPLLGSAMSIETVSTDLTADLPGPAERVTDLLVVGAASVLVFGLIQWLVRSQLTALALARSAVAARRAVDLRFRTNFERSPMGIAEVGHDGRIIDVNPALCRQVGAHREELVGRSVTGLVHSEDRERYQAKLRAVTTGLTEAARSEHRYVRRDGSVVWVDESLSVMSDVTGKDRNLLLQTQDITTRRRATSELAHQAFHDDLTGLPNRALFLDRLRRALQNLERHPGYVTVMFIDLDRFKVINDSLGHEAGDRFLQETAARLNRAVRGGDTVARFGGDEFVVLCEAMSGPSEANYVAGRIQSALGEPHELGSANVGGSTASIGITMCQDPRASGEELLRDADAAMYRAKEKGRNRVELFDTGLRHEVVARMEIEAQLRRALENGEMLLHYQAIVDIETGLPSGYEALIRWHHPDKGLLGPGAFLHVAEDAGVMHLIDAFALRAVCTQIAEWSGRHHGFRRMYISVNWSARQLEHYVSLTEQVLHETGIDPHQLLIEVTEGFLLEDSAGSMRALQRLKKLGVGIAIDDFGTGYSSLSYLTRLDVDYLKIDRSFVVQIPDPAATAIIAAIADMARRLNMALIVEGVESDEQLDFLAGIGPLRVQGYRFSRPRGPAEIEEALAYRFAIDGSVASVST